VHQDTLSLPPMPKGSYAEVIKGPIRRLDGTARAIRMDDALVDALLADIEAGGAKDALPLLAFTLERLYAEYGATGHLTVDHYVRLGGVKGSIEAAVERAFKVADSDTRVPRDRQARLTLLRRGFIPWLAGIDPDTKAPRRRVARLSEIPAEARPLIDLLVEQHLLSTDLAMDTGEKTIEPAHEALLRQWGSLQGWLEEDFEALATLESVKRAARDWATNGCHPEWLAHLGGRLDSAERLLGRKDLAHLLNRSEQDYLAACRRASDTARKRDKERLARDRLSTWMGGVSLALLIIFISLLTFSDLYAVFRQVPILAQLEDTWTGLFLRRQLNSQHPDVAIVGITDDTLSEYRPSYLPINRRLVAKLVDTIDSMYPRAIGIDLLFTSPSDGDDDLIDALKRAKSRVVLAAADERTIGLSVDQREKQQAFFHEVGRPTGYSNLATGRDSIVRFIARSIPDGAYPKSFAARLTESAGSAPAKEGPRIAWLSTPRDSTDTFLTISAETLFRPADDLVVQVLRAVLKDKIVLVGGMLHEIDTHLTPLSNSPYEKMHGVEIHAQITAQLIDGVFLDSMDPLLQICISLALALTGLAMGRACSRKTVYLLALLVLMPMSIAVDFALYRWHLESSVAFLLIWVLSLIAGVIYGRLRRLRPFRAQTAARG